MKKSIILVTIIISCIFTTYAQPRKLLFNCVSKKITVENDSSLSKHHTLRFEKTNCDCTINDITIDDNTINWTATHDITTANSEINIKAKCGDNEFSEKFKLVVPSNADNNIKTITTYQPTSNILKKTYDRNKNTAYFYFDDKGNLMQPKPVNIDADDIIVVEILQKKNENIYVNVEGNYSPTDLEINQSEKPTVSGGENKKDDEYIRKKVSFGPFTDEIEIKIYNDNGLLNNIPVKINKLYHVTFGPALINSKLANPDYDIFPLGNNKNTINKINDGNRNIATFNVVYYWKPTVDWAISKLKNGSHITRGRDILKEATFWERLNPIFGVSLNNSWKTNYFYGASFEFARGGAVIAGWHKGETQILADKNFKLGESEFVGNKTDIKLSNEYKTAMFIGIMMDVRILNNLTK